MQQLTACEYMARLFINSLHVNTWPDLLNSSLHVNTRADLFVKEHIRLLIECAWNGADTFRMHCTTGGYNILSRCDSILLVIRISSIGPTLLVNNPPVRDTDIERDSVE